MSLTSILSAIAGGLLSILFSYVPRFSDWFDALDATTKRLIMLGCLFATSLLLFGAACGKILAQLPLGIDLPCDENGVVTLLVSFVFAIIGNQSVYQISPQKVNTVTKVVPAATLSLLGEDASAQSVVIQRVKK